MVVALGRERSTTVLSTTLVATYVITALFIVLRVFPVSALITFATVPLAWFAAARARKYFDKALKLLPANFAIIGLHLTYSILLTLAVLI